MSVVTVHKQVSSVDAPTRTYYGAMAMVTTLFFMWGFVTCLNDILVPHLKSIFDLNYTKVMLVQFAFFTSYCVFAWPSAKIVESIGYKKSMVVGLCTMALGALLFLPSANVPSFWLFLGALVVVAAGMTILQVSANPYVSILGPPSTASSRLSLTGGFNSLGTTVAPFLGSLFILSAAPKSGEELRSLSASALQVYRLHETATVKLPYLIITFVLISIALAIGMFKFPRIEATMDFRPGAGEESTDSIWHYRHLVLGAVAIFVYVGAEVAIGSFLVSYFNQPDIGGLSLQTAAKFLPIYWGGLMVGRFAGSALLQKTRPGTTLGIVAVVACCLVLASMLTFGHVAMVTILAVGLFNAIMWPAIFTLGIAELGPLTGKGSGLLISAILGGAIIPLAQGAIADRIGLHHAFILPVLCYMYIAYYGFKGSHPTRFA